MVDLAFEFSLASESGWVLSQWSIHQWSIISLVSILSLNRAHTILKVYAEGKGLLSNVVTSNSEPVALLERLGRGGGGVGGGQHPFTMKRSTGR